MKEVIKMAENEMTSIWSSFENANKDYITKQQETMERFNKRHEQFIEKYQKEIESKLAEIQEVAEDNQQARKMLNDGNNLLNNFVP